RCLGVPSLLLSVQKVLHHLNAAELDSQTPSSLTNRKTCNIYQCKERLPCAYVLVCVLSHEWHFASVNPALCR
ncbi:hypothetical protein L9F63_026073, partial [Diploptera punctata]